MRLRVGILAVVRSVVSRCMLAMQSLVDSDATAYSTSCELATPQLLAFHSAAGNRQLFVHYNLGLMAATMRRWRAHLPTYVRAFMLNGEVILLTLRLVPWPLRMRACQLKLVQVPSKDQVLF